MSKASDKMWIWGHEAGSHDNSWGLKGRSRMTPAEGACYLGVPNLIMVRYNNKPAPPFDKYLMALSPLKRVVWSIVGAGGRTENNEIASVCNLASRFPNICGVMMDDFFRKPDHELGLGVFSPDEIDAIRRQLAAGGRKLDLWVVLYDYQLDLPVTPYLRQCDVVTFWTWRAKDIDSLEQNMERFERLVPSARKLLGCYMWDYGTQKPVPLPLMEKQCRLGLEWLNAGRIDGMIFLASCICDLGLEAVEWTKNWIREQGGRTL
jgi:hypothetical protein